MLAEQLDLSLENPGSHGDILPSNLIKVKVFCLPATARPRPPPIPPMPDGDERAELLEG